MQKLELDVKPRDLGQKEAKRNLNQLRQEGWVPGVIYGHGDPVSVSLEAKTFYKAIHTKSGRNALFTLTLGGESTLGIIKEIQRHVLTHKPIHVDFQRISVTEKLEISIPTLIVGEAPGVKTSGGILEHMQRDIRVRCLPDDIPASIDVDVSHLELGHGIKVEDLKPPKGVEFITPGDHIIVNIVAVKFEEVATPAAGAVGSEAAAQPEVITKGKKDEEGAVAAAIAPVAPAAPAKGEKEKKK